MIKQIENNSINVAVILSDKNVMEYFRYCGSINSKKKGAIWYLLSLKYFFTINIELKRNMSSKRDFNNYNATSSKIFSYF